jgi:hypothetical protein
MTMNPNDKYITPRAAPLTPRLPRLNTSPAILDTEDFPQKLAVRSASPKSSKLPWSPRNLFRHKSASPVESPVEPVESGRSEQLSPIDGDANISYPTLLARSDAALNRTYNHLSIEKSGAFNNQRSIPGTMSSRSPHTSRETSPARPSPRVLASTLRPRKSTANLNLLIPEDINEDEEDDCNFAGIEPERPPPATMLSPAPNGRRVPFPTLRIRTTILRSSSNKSAHNDKPLPKLPLKKSISTPEIQPAPLRLAPLLPTLESELESSSLQGAHLPRSYISIDSLSTDYSAEESADSIYNFYDDRTIDDSPMTFQSEPQSADSDAHDSVQPTPDLEHREDIFASKTSWQGYSLPIDELGSELTLTKETSNRDDLSKRETFGGLGLDLDLGTAFIGGSTLGDFMEDMGYLGDVIVNRD